MQDPRDSLPAYRTVRVGPPTGRKAALADEQAWRARSAYPNFASLGGAAFGIVRELETGGWQLSRDSMDPWPQDTRDTMGHYFRVMAAEHPDDSETHAAYMRAAVRMDWEAIDEQTVLGTRFRVIRAEQIIRTGPSGPEPPRPSDAERSSRAERKGIASHTLHVTEDGFVIDPFNSTTMSQGILTMELLKTIVQASPATGKAREDLERAAYTHPGGVLLPAAFTVARLTRGKWGPITMLMSTSPRDARESLVGYLRVSLPYDLDLTDEQRAPYNAAADTVENENVDEVSVAGNRFRVIRVERLVRIGPDGPEGPRPSDPDPQPPVMLNPDGTPAPPLPDEEEDDEPHELSPGAQRLHQLFEEEHARQAARRNDPPPEPPDPQP